MSESAQLSNHEFVAAMRALVCDPTKNKQVCWCPRCQPWREALDRIERAQKYIDRLEMEAGR